MLLGCKTFRYGGIHITENKHYTEDLEIKNFHIPKRVIIPLAQHTGKPAKPVVKKGDIVSEGQLIGEKDGKISANIHSSIPGKVVDINYYTVLANPRVLSVEVQFEGELKTGPLPKRDWEYLSKEEILRIIEEAGIVGMGGAMFPTAVKYAPPENKKVDTLIINGAECEPYITADYRLMLEKPDEIIEGIKIAKKILGVDKVFIGVEDNKRKAIKKLKERIAKKDGMKVIKLKTKYPQGGEKQLIKAILNREVPSGGLPFDVGVVVSNVATIYAIREAVLFNRPLIERVVTITGKIVKNPGNYKIRIGTLISDILKEVGIEGEIGKVIIGGPMMGINVPTLDTPITKGTSCVLFLSKKEASKVKYSDFLPCIHCGRCVSVCPIRLNPALLSILGENERWADMKEFNLFDCIECGSCAFVCPAQRPIVQFIKLGKFKNV